MKGDLFLRVRPPQRQFRATLNRIRYCIYTGWRIDQSFGSVLITVRQIGSSMVKPEVPTEIDKIWGLIIQTLGSGKSQESIALKRKMKTQLDTTVLFLFN